MKNNPLIIAVVLIIGIVIFTNMKEKPTIAPINSQSVVLAFGDSLTYGTGAAEGASYPDHLRKKLGTTIHNYGIPGEVSEAGLNRLHAILKKVKPTHVILCHGGNDILQKKSRSTMKSNISQMISLCKNSGADVVLIAVPEFGFTMSPPELYEELAEEHKLPIDHSSLKEIVTSTSLKSDYVHPNAQGYKILADNIYTLIKDSE